MNHDKSGDHLADVSILETPTLMNPAKEPTLD
jgi:hypothetical protein